MKLQASFSALGLFVVIAMSDGERAHIDSTPATEGVIDVAKCISRVDLVEHLQRYDFFGKRATDAGQSLRQRLLVTADYEGRQKRFTGQTDWHIEWRACFDAPAQGCRITGVVSTVQITYTLPRWADQTDAQPQLRSRWNHYLTSLAAHERGHGEIAKRVAALIDDALIGMTHPESCTALDRDAAHVVDRVMQRGEEMQREYDRATSHGTAQGAVFPF